MSGKAEDMPMASLDQINDLLIAASAFLDRAAGKIRDAGLEPTHAHIERIGRALSEIVEIKQEIHALRPDLEPAYLKQPPGEFAEANRLLVRCVFQASELQMAGDVQAAVAVFKAYLDIETSALHRDIALGEIERLDAAQDD